VCCSVLQCVAVCCSVLQTKNDAPNRPQHAWCSVLQCVAVCCSVLQWLITGSSMILSWVHILKIYFAVYFDVQNKYRADFLNHWKLIFECLCQLDAGPPPTAGTMEKMVQNDKSNTRAGEEEMEEEEEAFGVNVNMKDVIAVRYPVEKLRIKTFSKRITGIAFTPGDLLDVYLNVYVCMCVCVCVCVCVSSVGLRLPWVIFWMYI